MKVVINQCHGGFSISAEALQEYIKLSGNKQATGYDISRNDINLVAIVEKLQEKAGCNIGGVITERSRPGLGGTKDIPGRKQASTATARETEFASWRLSAGQHLPTL